jgi:hypothetical protein
MYPNPPKIFTISKKIPENVTIFLEIFLKVPLTMLLGTFFKNQNGEFLPQKIKNKNKNKKIKKSLG